MLGASSIPIRRALTRCWSLCRLKNGLERLGSWLSAAANPADAPGLFSNGRKEDIGSPPVALEEMLSTALSYWNVEASGFIGREVKELELARDEPISRGDACALVYRVLGGIQN